MQASYYTSLLFFRNRYKEPVPGLQCDLSGHHWHQPLRWLQPYSPWMSSLPRWVHIRYILKHDDGISVWQCRAVPCSILIGLSVAQGWDCASSSVCSLFYSDYVIPWSWSLPISYSTLTRNPSWSTVRTLPCEMRSLADLALANYKTVELV